MVPCTKFAFWLRFARARIVLKKSLRINDQPGIKEPRFHVNIFFNVTLAPTMNSCFMTIIILTTDGAGVNQLFLQTKNYSQIPTQSHKIMWPFQTIPLPIIHKKMLKTYRN